MNIKKLILTPIRFYSYEDKEIFFTWLNKIKCIKDYKGIGKEIHATISVNNATFEDLRDLKGLFKRYRLKNISQLEDIFIDKENKKWLDSLSMFSCVWPSLK
jgi:hypothetical protein